jgi:hypothetical protein
MITAQPSALSGQLSAGKALSDAKQVKKGLPRTRMIIDELQGTASLLQRAESLKK